MPLAYSLTSKNGNVRMNFLQHFVIPTKALRSVHTLGILSSRPERISSNTNILKKEDILLFSTGKSSSPTKESALHRSHVINSCRPSHKILHTFMLSMSLEGLQNFLSRQTERTAHNHCFSRVPSGLAQRMLDWHKDTGTELLPLSLICQHTPFCFWLSYSHLIATPNYVLNSIYTQKLFSKEQKYSHDLSWSH